MRQLPLYLLSLIASLAILANSFSHWYAKSNPILAIWFNPLSSEPRLEKVQMDVENLKSDADIEYLLDILKTGIAYEPYDARLYGLLGLGEELNGSSINETQPLYQHSLTLNKTELRALLRSFAYEVYTGEVEQALEKAQLIFRAWPTHWDTIEQYIPSLLVTPEGYDFAKEHFASLPKWPRDILKSLAKTDTGLDTARRLLLDWQREGIPNLRPTLNHIISGLILKNRYFDAYLLHGLTLKKSEQAEASLVFNSEFNLEPNGDPFNWQLPRIAGVGFEIVNRVVKNPDKESVEYDRALEVQFLNTPVRLVKPLQFVRLPSARLNWTVSYSTRALKGPKPIQLAIRCYPSSKVLQKVVIPMSEPGDTGGIKIITSHVEPPTEGCELQQIIILNDNLVESWRNRYSGSLFLHSVKIDADGKINAT